MKLETLTLPTTEMRFQQDDNVGTFEGYAAIFNEPLEVYGEVVRPGAFAKTLAEHKTRNSMPGLFWNHNSSEPIGVWTNMVEDERGLKVSGKLIPEIAKAREVSELIKASAVSGISIGFFVRKANRIAGGLREILELNLVEASLTSIPASVNSRITDFRSQYGQPHAESIQAFNAAMQKANRAFKKGN